MQTARLTWTASDLPALASACHDLAAVPPSNPLFLHPTWQDLWRRHFGVSLEMGAFTLNGGTPGSNGAGPSAVAPLVRTRRLRGPAMSVRFDLYPGDQRFLTRAPRYRVLPVTQVSPAVSLESGDLRGGIATAFGADGHRHGVAALVDSLMATKGWNVAAFPVSETDVPAWIEALDRADARSRVLPDMRAFAFREAPCSWDDFLRAAGRHRRKRAWQAEKYLTRDGYRLEVWQSPPDVARGLEALADLAEKSWKASGREGTDIVVPYTARARVFHEDLCRADAVDLTPVVCVILDGSDMPVAAMLSVICRSTLVPLLTFYDPSVAKRGPGQFLIKGLFDLYERTDGRAFSRIDFNATHEWVLPYADRQEPYHLFLLFSPTLYGRFLDRIVSATGAYMPLATFADRATANGVEEAEQTPETPRDSE